MSVTWEMSVGEERDWKDVFLSTRIPRRKIAEYYFDRVGEGTSICRSIFSNWKAGPEIPGCAWKRSRGPPTQQQVDISTQQKIRKDEMP
jgi:hypothetical protein